MILGQVESLLRTRALKSLDSLLAVGSEVEKRENEDVSLVESLVDARSCNNFLMMYIYIFLDCFEQYT